jgi:hypothetical protein
MTTVLSLWRVVVTDSKKLDGISPVCPRQMQPGGLHQVNTGRPRWAEFDRHGIYDCCPGPHLRAPDTHVAAELADMMSASGVRAG